MTLVKIGAARPEEWKLSAREFSEQTGLRGGLWVAERFDRADALTTLPAMALAALTIACFAIVLVAFIRMRDAAYAAMVAVQILVFLVAVLVQFRGGG